MSSSLKPNKPSPFLGKKGREKVDRCSQGLKPNIKLEVMKVGAQTMSDASRIALNFDSALFGAGMFRFQDNGGFLSSQYVPTEIGNLEQRDQDRSNNACFKCHKVGCRPVSYTHLTLPTTSRV